MDLGLVGKVAIVTGGSAGIGYAAARSLAREGARVVVCARTASTLAEAAHALREDTGGEIVEAAGDVSKDADIRRLFDIALGRFGRLDVLVNNAGKSHAAPLLTVDDAGWQDDLDLKLFAAIRTMRLAVPHMQAAGGGSIVNVVNIGAKAPAASSLPTSVSRAAGIALTKAASRDLAPHNIRVNAVCIGLIKSEQHLRRARAANRMDDLDTFYAELAKAREVPLGRVGEAEEAADLIAFLASDRARYISGTAINMDGGASAVV
ncbi:MAG: SDR family oxidoreductase [Chloroflexi bacterium]|nr:SDR family oxidoreductase [Chloroflexota bacterium]